MLEVNQRDDALQEELSTVRLTNGAVEAALQFAEDVRAGIENADYETKRRILALLEVRVVVSGRRFSVGCLAGAWEGEIRALPKRGIANGLSLSFPALREKMHLFYDRILA